MRVHIYVYAVCMYVCMHVWCLRKSQKRALGTMELESQMLSHHTSPGNPGSLKQPVLLTSELFSQPRISLTFCWFVLFCFFGTYRKIGVCIRQGKGLVIKLRYRFCLSLCLCVYGLLVWQNV